MSPSYVRRSGRCEEERQSCNVMGHPESTWEENRVKVQATNHEVTPQVPRTCWLRRSEILITNGSKTPRGHFTREQAAEFGKGRFIKVSLSGVPWENGIYTVGR